MDGSFPGPASGTQKHPKRVLVRLINWLTSLITITDEEWEDTGIYLDRPGGE